MTKPSANLSLVDPTQDNDTPSKTTSRFSWNKIREVGQRLAQMPGDQIAKIKNMTLADAAKIGSSALVGIGSKALVAAAIGSGGTAIAVGAGVAILGGALSGGVNSAITHAVKRYKEVHDPMLSPIPPRTLFNAACQETVGLVKHMTTSQFRKDVSRGAIMSTAFFGAAEILDQTGIGHTVVEKFKETTSPYLKDTWAATKLRAWFGAESSSTATTPAAADTPQPAASAVTDAAQKAPPVETTTPAPKTPVAAHHHTAPTHHHVVHAAPAPQPEPQAPQIPQTNESFGSVQDDERAKALAWVAEQHPVQPEPIDMDQPGAREMAQGSDIEQQEPASPAKPLDIPNPPAEFEPLKDHLVMHELANMHHALKGEFPQDGATIDDIAKTMDSENPDTVKATAEKQIKDKLAGACVTKTDLLPDGDIAVTNNCVINPEIKSGDYVIVRDETEGRKSVKAMFKYAASGLREKTAEFVNRIMNPGTGILADTVQGLELSGAQPQ